MEEIAPNVDFSRTCGFGGEILHLFNTANRGDSFLCNSREYRILNYAEYRIWLSKIKFQPVFSNSRLYNL